MKLLHYPDPKLTVNTKNIIEFNDELKTVIKQMTVIMEENKGVGLATTQVGLDLRMFLLKDNKGKIHAICNPELIEENGTVIGNEGCLSAPGIYLQINRPETLIAEFYTENGDYRKAVFVDLEARIFMHELEHLNKEFYFNRVSRQVRKVAIKELEKNIKSL